MLCQMGNDSETTTKALRGKPLADLLFGSMSAAQHGEGFRVYKGFGQFRVWGLRFPQNCQGSTALSRRLQINKLPCFGGPK